MRLRWDVVTGLINSSLESFCYLQAAKTQQAIRSEEMGVELVERRRRIELEELERQRTHFRLEAEVRSPAASECFRLRALSEAEQVV